MKLVYSSRYGWLDVAEIQQDTNNLREQIILTARNARIKKNGKFYTVDEAKIEEWICIFCDCLNDYFINEDGMFEEDRDVLKAHLADMTAIEFINFADVYTLSYVNVDVDMG